MLGLAAALVAPALLVAPASAAPPERATVPGEALAEDLLVIGHRGASGYRPEHTLASYELAARMGADYIEPDVVSTKDGVLVARHENEISGTTDVEERAEFADRKTTKTIDGQQVTGWFTEDFTLAELRTLWAEERLPGLREENTLYDGLYRVPLVQLLWIEGAPYDQQISGGTTYQEMATAEGLAEIAEYADGVGPEKSFVIPRDEEGGLGEPTSFVDDAHAAGLLVHPYTFRNEDAFLPPALWEGAAPDDYGQAIQEQTAFWEAGIDGMFTDNPDTGVVSRDLFEG